MWTSVHWGWWLPVGVSVYLAVAAILAFQRTRQWMFCVFFVAACLGLLGSVFSVCAKVSVAARGGVFELPAGALKEMKTEELAEYARTISEHSNELWRTDSWARLSKFGHWLAYTVAAVGALVVIINLSRKPVTQSSIEESPPCAETSPSPQIEPGYGRWLPIIVCATLCIQTMICLMSDWDELVSGRASLSYVLPILALAVATVTASVFVVRSNRKSILAIIGAVIFSLVLLLISEDVAYFLTVAVCVIGLAASILLIFRHRQWLALGVGGILVSLMVLFPHPPHFLW